jgi:hypothetical protein
VAYQINAVQVRDNEKNGCGITLYWTILLTVLGIGLCSHVCIYPSHPICFEN